MGLESLLQDVRNVIEESEHFPKIYAPTDIARKLKEENPDYIGRIDGLNNLFGKWKLAWLAAATPYAFECALVNSLLSHTSPGTCLILPSIDRYLNTPKTSNIAIPIDIILNAITIANQRLSESAKPTIHLFVLNSMSAEHTPAY